MSELVNIETTCLTCKHFDCQHTVKTKCSPQLISLGLCNRWCHKVLGDEFCSRGSYDKNWMERRG